MAKNNNLTDFLTGVADAIRAKKGKTGVINPQNFESEISTINTQKTEQSKTVPLAMSSGDQMVTPDSGKVLSKVVITKPTTLIPGNIKSGVSIGGVTGTYEIKSEIPHKTITSNGITTITPTDGYLMSKVVVVTNVPIPETQDKTVTITEGGTSIFIPDDGKVFSKVTVNVDINSLPQLNAPTIVIANDTLTITNPSTNGNFCTKFKIFVNGAMVSEQTETSLNLSTCGYFADSATYSITVKCAGEKFNDSEASNAENYTYTKPLELSYVGVGTALSKARYSLATTTVGNYALFGGGEDGSKYYDTIDAYDTSLTRTTPTALSVARYGLAATTVGNYALFGGGASSNVVDAYDISLTRTTPTALSKERKYLAATTVGNYALFGGGGYISSKVVDAYDTNLTRTIPTALSVSRFNLAATTVGNYALFGGGEDSSSPSSVVDAYDTSLTRTIPTALPSLATKLAATTVGNYALFGGGSSNNSDYNAFINAYDSSLTRTTFGGDYFGIRRESPAATTVGNYALFGGGYYQPNRLNTVDAYDTSLTRTIPTALSVARHSLAATTVGNYALFGGGDSKPKASSIAVNTVDVYKVQ